MNLITDDKLEEIFKKARRKCIVLQFMSKHFDKIKHLGYTPVDWV